MAAAAVDAVTLAELICKGGEEPGDFSATSSTSNPPHRALQQRLGGGSWAAGHGQALELALQQLAVVVNLRVQLDAVEEKV